MDCPLYQSAEISALLNSSTLTSPSSVPLGWDGVAVERHIIGRGEKPELSINQHFLILWDTHIAVGESERSPGKFVPYKKLPHTITTCPPGIRPAIRSATEHEVLVVQFPGVFWTRSKQSSINDRLASFTSFTEQTNPFSAI